MHKITKLKAVENPVVQTASSDKEYRDSVVNGLFNSFEDKHLSPSVDYWIIGELMAPPVVGQSLMVNRWNRNGVLCMGIFTTSPITKITDDGFETMNSVYKMEEVDDEEILAVNTTV